MSNDVEKCKAEEFIKLCFADDVKNFWNKFDNWKQGQSFYTSDIDPDQRSKMLYDAHQRLWNKQQKNCEIHRIWNGNAYQLDEIMNGERLSLGSDSIISIYWHRDQICTFVRKLIESKGYNYKDFIQKYLQESNTIGGFILFPRHPQSINQRRGTNSQIGDRFDLTLECIKRYYDKVKSPLYDVLDKDKDFFKMFGSFENYAKFFCLDDVWVKNGQVLSLLNNHPLDHWDFNDNPLPTEGNWWTFYENIMSRLDERNKKIKALIEAKVQD